jgi:N-acetylneuraminate synthase
VTAWKVPSGEIANAALLDMMIATGLPLILSTGMSPLEEIDVAVERIKTRRVPLAVLQCTSSYPCPPEKVGLNVIPLFRERYAVGLSDHSGTIFPSLAAATLGVQFLEVHVTLSREMFGPDVPASITTAELRQAVSGIRFIEKMMARPADKDQTARELEVVRNTFMKSVVVRTDLPVGTVLREEHLTVKKPGTGIPAARLKQLVGRQLRRAITADTLLSEEDLD